MLTALQYQLERQFMRQELAALRPRRVAVHQTGSTLRILPAAGAGSSSDRGSIDGGSGDRPEDRSLAGEPAAWWVIDFADDLMGDRLSGTALLERLAERSRAYARQKIADYWVILPERSELRTYELPEASGYQQCRFWGVGEQVSPTSFPDITLQVQESVPLHFLTRTASGHRTYAASVPPLLVV